MRDYLLLFSAEYLASIFFIKNVKIKICRIIIFLVVLCGCKNWSLTLRVERGSRAFENQVLRRICWPKSDEGTGDWRSLHNWELYVF